MWKVIEGEMDGGEVGFDMMGYVEGDSRLQPQILYQYGSFDAIDHYRGSSSK